MNINASFISHFAAITAQFPLGGTIKDSFLIFCDIVNTVFPHGNFIFKVMCCVRAPPQRFACRMMDWTELFRGYLSQCCTN